ncbi:MAG: hypothetical protein RL481_1050, partial [Pseudomonadota bacterium]
IPQAGGPKDHVPFDCVGTGRDLQLHPIGAWLKRRLLAFAVKYWALCEQLVDRFAWLRGAETGGKIQ